MSGTLAIALLIVVWLLVLAPWFLRGERPIRKVGDAFDSPRVVYEGGSGEPITQPRPTVTAADVHHHDLHDDDDVELETAEVLLDDETSPHPGSFGVGEKLKEATKRWSRKPAEVPEVVDGEVVHELPCAAVQDHAEVSEATASTAEDAAGTVAAGLESYDEQDAVLEYTYDDAYISPADVLHPDAADNDLEDAQLDALERGEDAEDAELSEEDLAFASRRIGRGGWDPDADRQHTGEVYRRRRWTVGGLLGITVLTLILAITIGGWAWMVCCGAGLLTAAYLVALRNQVRAEEDLRRRRIRQLRRARMGVRHQADEELGIPERLRRPGAVVLELDDASPDFSHLSSVDYGATTPDKPLMSRRVG